MSSNDVVPKFVIQSIVVVNLAGIQQQFVQRRLGERDARKRSHEHERRHRKLHHLLRQACGVYLLFCMTLRGSCTASLQTALQALFALCIR